MAPRIHTLVSRKAELDAMRQEAANALHSRRLVIEDVEVIRRYVDDLKGLLGSATMMDQKAFIKAFVKNISVSRDDLTINYTLPMPPLNADKETIGVLAFISNGEPFKINARTFEKTFALVY